MSKPVPVRDAELIQALEEGANCIVVGDRRFLLVKVDEAADEPYLVTEPAEVELVRESLQDNIPRRSGEDAMDYLKARLREHGIS